MFSSSAGAPSTENRQYLRAVLRRVLKEGILNPLPVRVLLVIEPIPTPEPSRPDTTRASPVGAVIPPPSFNAAVTADCATLVVDMTRYSRSRTAHIDNTE